MNNIIYNDNIITPKNNKYHYYRKFIKKLNHRDCVKFALFCAKTVNPNTKETNHCIELVEKWLLDKKLINIEELQNAARDINEYNYVLKTTNSVAAVYAVYTTNFYADYNFHMTSLSIDYDFYITNATFTVCNAMFSKINIANDLNLYLQTLLRTTKQYNIKNHNNQHYEFILKQIINEDIDKITDTDYNMLTDISQEYYNINPNIINKRIFIELLRKEYE